MADSMKLEHWRNPHRNRVQVQMTDERGNMSAVLVGPGKNIHIKPEDRRYNSELAFNADMDVFKNGSLTPVRLIEGDEDEAEISANPNHIGEEEMHKLLKEHHKKFDARLAEITNTSTVERMLEIATAEDADVTVRVVSKLRERLEKLQPSNVTETTPLGNVHDTPREGFRPVTPV